MNKPKFKGRCVFDGIIKITLGGEEYTLQTDEDGYYLRQADPNKEIVMLTVSHSKYDEVDTGFVSLKPVKEAPYGEMVCLKTSPKDKFYSVFTLPEIIAWGYVDGGLEDKSQHRYCQRTN